MLSLWTFTPPALSPAGWQPALDEYFLTVQRGSNWAETGKSSGEINKALPFWVGA